jgi:SAM-dependent methyltransferase
VIELCPDRADRSGVARENLCSRKATNRPAQLVRVDLLPYPKEDKLGFDCVVATAGTGPPVAATGWVQDGVVHPLGKDELQNQARHWSRHAERYDELFLDPFGTDVENPLWSALDAVPDPERKSVADLGCGTGPLLPYLAERFGQVIALDFAPAMLKQARKRLGPSSAGRVVFLERPIHDLDDFAGKVDIAIATNSLVIPDVRLIDRSLRSIRSCLKPDGQFLGIVPSIDAIIYHFMLLMDQAIDQGLGPTEAERFASLNLERRRYDFVFGKFRFQGIHQKFWRPFEVEYRLKKAGFTTVSLQKILYPWDADLPVDDALADFPRSWDWFFQTGV